jgi:Domain of unknown function (4846)
MRVLPMLVLVLISCQSGYDSVPSISSAHPVQALKVTPVSYPEGTWQGFLQHLPSAKKPILDYRGKLIRNQAKHAAIITYDVGSADLQQCADALIRIRAEYLFGQKRIGEIGFHFMGGGYYSFVQYLKGIRPISGTKRVTFVSFGSSMPLTHQSLRKYLDIVYAYANTVSLCKELLPTDRFDVGTVIIYPGFPGHCCLIVDKGVISAKDTVYKLVEGYMPAQSIYILSNPYEPHLSPWYHLQKGMIATASFEFRRYYLRRFE